MMFVRAYPRETQEMVFDAHDRAFAFFKGACVRGIYDNMKTAVESIFLGKDRAYNRRFLQMCGHYLVEPTACTPASGWEKGQVENQVGLVRERFFTPRLRVKSLEELNSWLLDKCVAYAKVAISTTSSKHSDVRSGSIASFRPWFGHFGSSPVNGHIQTVPAKLGSRVRFWCEAGHGNSVECRAYCESCSATARGSVERHSNSLLSDTTEQITNG
jgi:hypothetical protein